jgi:hypothetical protein
MIIRNVLLSYTYSSELSWKGVCIVLRVFQGRNCSVGALTLVLIGILLVGGSVASAAVIKQFTDRIAFNAAAINRTVIDFEGLAPPGGFTFYGNPGSLVLSGVIFQSNGPLFVQNAGAAVVHPGLCCSGSRLSFQQLPSMNILTMPLPTNVSAVGFDYLTADPVTVTLFTEQSSQLFNINTSPFPNFSFIGFTADESIRTIQVVTTVNGADVDNFTFGLKQAVQYLSFTDGRNPGIPGDGIVVSSLPLAGFTVDPPFRFDNVKNGITFSAFFRDTKPGVDVTDIRLDLGFFGRAPVPPCGFLAAVGSFSPPIITPPVNGVQGIAVSFSQEQLDALLAPIRQSPECAALTVADVVLGNVLFFKGSGFGPIPDLDAFAIGLGENIFP